MMKGNVTDIIIQMLNYNMYPFFIWGIYAFGVSRRHE